MNIKNKISRFTCLFLMVSVLLGLFLPNCSRIMAEDEGNSNGNELGASADEPNEMGFFVVEKTWSNDTDENDKLITENGVRNRPTSVNIRIEGTDNSAYEAQLKESEGWKKSFRLPIKSNDQSITYTVYETDEFGKYVSNATSTSKLTISQLKSGRKSNVFNVVPSGFSRQIIEQPTVSINGHLDLSKATITFSEGSHFGYDDEDPVVYDGVVNGESNTVDSLIYYDGPLNGPPAGATIENNYYDNLITGTIVLEWKDSSDFHPATDIYGRTYPVKMTISNIVIRTLTSLNKRIAILAYGVKNVAEENKRLMMQSYVGDFTSGNTAANIVGVQADINVEIVGIPDDNFTMNIFDDIDVADLVDYYRQKGTVINNNYYGLNYPFSESVQLIGPISSDVHINNGTTFLVYNNNRRFSSIENHNESSFINHYTMMIYLVPAEGYSFRWTGSDCGTEIFMDVDLPDPDDYTTSISNVSGLYKVRYFFQKDDGSYNKPENPDYTDDLVMVKPGTAVSVKSVNAKTNPTDVDPKKTNYELDTTKTDVEATTTVTKDNTVDEPAYLDVYFRKTCVVVYHDNLNEDLSIGTLWDPKDQTTKNNLHIDDTTPAFKGDVTNAYPGYKFTGWTIVDPKDRSETKLDNDEVLPKVDREETHYLAHWEALPNEYIVHYFYEVDGQYPSKDNPTDISEVRNVYNGEKVYTDSHVGIEPSDLIPDPKRGSYVLNDAMNGEWEGTVKWDGLILRVYFKQKSTPYNPPVTGIN